MLRAVASIGKKFGDTDARRRAARSCVRLVHDLGSPTGTSAQRPAIAILALVQVRAAWLHFTPPVVVCRFERLAGVELSLSCICAGAFRSFERPGIFRPLALP